MRRRLFLNVAELEDAAINWLFSGYRFVGDRFVMGEGGRLLR